MTELHVVCPHCDSINRIPPERQAGAGRCGRCKQPLFGGEPLALDTVRFERHLRSGSLPLLVDFWAPWCGPCRAMAPVFARAARELEPAVRLVKVNTEEEPALASRFGIRSIPTLALMQGGRELARTAGAMDLAGLLGWVRSHLRAG